MAVWLFNTQDLTAQDIFNAVQSEVLKLNEQANGIGDSQGLPDSDNAFTYPTDNHKLYGTTPPQHGTNDGMTQAEADNGWYAATTLTALMLVVVVGKIAFTRL